MKNSLYRSKGWVLLITLFLGTFSVSLSQSGRRIEGRILEGDQGKPVAFATVRVCGEAYGALSNERGEFDLYLPAKFAQNSLCISSIGYKDLEIPLSSLESGQILSLSLESSTFLLDSVNIAERKGKLPSAKNLVRRALRRIQPNYPQEPFQLTGYYRDYIRQDTGYINLFEAALSIQDPGFRKKVLEKSQGEILQTRFRESLQVDTLVAGAYRRNFKVVPAYNMPAYGGNEFTILQAHDPIRNYNIESFSFVYRIVKDFVRNHVFELDSIIIQGEVPLYQISFALNTARARSLYVRMNKVNKDLVKGKIWIRSDTYGMVKFEYANFFEDDLKKKRYEIAVEYQELRDKLYLKYISMNNYFEMDDSTKTPFHVVGVSILNERDQFVLRFNRAPAPGTIGGSHYYKVFHGGYKFEVTKCEPTKPNSVVLTVPGIENSLLEDPAVEGIYIEKEELEALLTSGTLDFKIDPSITDENGIPVDTYPKKGMYQFREWFVNEIDATPAKELEQKLDKLKPLYLQAREDDSDFWDSFTVMLNAPLKSE